MARKKLTETNEEVKQETNSEIKVDNTKYTHTALSVYKDKATRKWMVAEIVFNPQTRECIMLPSRISADSRDLIIEKFKIEAVNQNIIG